MALKDDIRLLGQAPVFAGLGEEQLRLLAFGAERRSVAAGQMLFRQDTPADCAFLVVSGKIMLTETQRDGSQKAIGEAGEGALISELAMISAIDRKFNATVIADSEVMRLTRSLFHRLLEEYPEVARRAQMRIAESLSALTADAGAMAGRFQ